MSKETDRKLKKRNIASLVFALVAMALFFPYKQLTWTIAFFALALAGAVLSAVALYMRNLGHEKSKAGTMRVLSTLGFWFTLVPFVAALAGILATGILACSVYTS